jgi:acylphosphatase
LTGFGGFRHGAKKIYGAWLSLVERCVRDAEADSSSLSAPIFFMKKQASVYYSGRVQGVGFRFTAVEIANELGIAGWVKNLSDGRVEVMAQAEEDDVKEFLERLHKTFASCIEDEDPNWKPSSEEFKGFEIKY